jgi:competence CoiA-like predicted nuclease
MEVERERRAPPLLIPWGRNQSGVLVSAAQAEKSVALTCPSCDSHLLLRQGTKRRPHFSYSADSSCNPEAALHLTAKLLIAQVVCEWTPRSPFG